MNTRADNGPLSRRALIWRLLLACSSGALLGLVLAVFAPPHKLSATFAREVAFEPVAWRTPGNRNEHEARRLAMARGLVRLVLKPGMNRDEVHALLGEPYPWPIFLGAHWFGSEDESWWLDDWGNAVRTDCDWLYLDYDSQGKLQRALVLSERATEGEMP